MNTYHLKKFLSKNTGNYKLHRQFYFWGSIFLLIILNFYVVIRLYTIEFGTKYNSSDFDLEVTFLVYFYILASLILSMGLVCYCIITDDAQDQCLEKLNEDLDQLKEKNFRQYINYQLSRRLLIAEVLNFIDLISPFRKSRK